MFCGCVWFIFVGAGLQLFIFEMTAHKGYSWGKFAQERGEAEKNKFRVIHSIHIYLTDCDHDVSVSWHSLWNIDSPYLWSHSENV